MRRAELLSVVFHEVYGVDHELLRQPPLECVVVLQELLLIVELQLVLLHLDPGADVLQNSVGLGILAQLAVDLLVVERVIG